MFGRGASEAFTTWLQMPIPCSSRVPGGRSDHQAQRRSSTGVSDVRLKAKDCDEPWRAQRSRKCQGQDRRPFQGIASDHQLRGRARLGRCLRRPSQGCSLQRTVAFRNRPATAKVMFQHHPRSTGRGLTSEPRSSPRLSPDVNPRGSDRGSTYLHHDARFNPSQRCADVQATACTVMIAELRDD